MLAGFLISQVQFFLLIMMRLFGMIAVAPFFSSVLVPMRIKAILAFGISLVIYPILAHEANIAIPENIVDYAILIINQLIIGITIGLIIAIIFAAFQLAGQFFSIQMGFGISEVFDPLSQIHVPLVGQLFALLGTLIFLMVQGHVVLIEGVYESFFKIPVLDIVKSSQPLSETILAVFVDMFTIALKISIPIMGTLFIVTLSMGLLAKFAPQMNILMLGFPVYITIGFIMLVLLMPSIIDNGQHVFNVYLTRLFELF